MSEVAGRAGPILDSGALPLITAESFETLAPEWAGLHQSIPNALPFAHPSWHEVWLRHCGGDAVPVFLALRVPADEAAERRLIGVIPLEVVGMEARFLGDPDLSDHSGLLVIPGLEEVAAAALLEWLMEDLASGFEGWGLPEAGSFRSALLTAADHYGWSTSEETEAITPTVELPGTWEDYVAELPRKDRHELRRKLRNLESAGETGFVSAIEPPELREEVDGLLEMMRESREKKAAFLTGQREAFFRDLASVFGEYGLARISALTLDGRPVARIFAFEAGGITMLYNSGFDPSLSSFAVGLLSKALLIRDAIERGQTVVDFLRGSEPYKRHLGGHPCDIVRLRLSRA